MSKTIKCIVCETEFNSNYDEDATCSPHCDMITDGFPIKYLMLQLEAKDTETERLKGLLVDMCTQVVDAGYFADQAKAILKELEG